MRWENLQRFKWYFVCTVSAEDALKFAEGNAVTLRFPFAISDSVTAVVDAVNQTDLDPRAYCNGML